jgi:hypothetical protein
MPSTVWRAAARWCPSELGSIWARCAGRRATTASATWACPLAWPASRSSLTRRPRRQPRAQRPARAARHRSTGGRVTQVRVLRLWCLPVGARSKLAKAQNPQRREPAVLVHAGVAVQTGGCARASGAGRSWSCATWTRGEAAASPRPCAASTCPPRAGARGAPPSTSRCPASGAGRPTQSLRARSAPRRSQPTPRRPVALCLPSMPAPDCSSPRSPLPVIHHNGLPLVCAVLHSGATPEVPALLHYACDLRTAVAVLPPLRVEVPPAASEAEADNRERLASVLGGRPLLALEFDRMVVRRGGPAHAGYRVGIRVLLGRSPAQHGRRPLGCWRLGGLLGDVVVLLPPADARGGAKGAADGGSRARREERPSRACKSVSAQPGAAASRLAALSSGVRQFPSWWGGYGAGRQGRMAG